MCLISIAHNASSRFPLVIAANRDEDYDRPTEPAHHWREAPEVVGGRDALLGGSWLAVRKGGRFAAVTNLSGARRRSRSRGFLVRDFVTGAMDVQEYAETIARDAHEYAGFHLIAGTAGDTVMYIAPELQAPLNDGIHAFSNAPAGELWPKVTIAREAMRHALNNEETLADELMRFLCTPRNTGSVKSEVFIAGNRYGTRASTVIVATERDILLIEQSHARGLLAGLPQVRLSIDNLQNM